MTPLGEILLQDGNGGWLRFCHPLREHIALDYAEVQTALRAVDDEIAAGMAVVGFVSYEAAAGIDAAFCVPESGGLPLLWFGVFREPQRLDELPPPVGSYAGLSDITAACGSQDYAKAMERIKRYIEDGDTYQVNYTIRLHGCLHGDTYAFFHNLHNAQRGHYSAYLEIGDFAICSASPELFFEVDGDTVRMRPMKGTSRRGLSSDADLELGRKLAASEKNRAENVMIVDMVRNDLGRIAEPGSVRVESLFDIERYPTVWQMTSTVSAVSQSGFSEMMQALFPCSSITGAPKVRTMEIIRELEREPRGIYTGTIGYWLPGRRARFNVAIRTAVVERSSGLVEYGTGGGIVWDSVDDYEFDECLAKAMILEQRAEEFELLETMLWRSGSGFYLLEWHLARMQKSATYFGYAFDEKSVRSALRDAMEDFRGECGRVRCRLDRQGHVTVDVAVFESGAGATPPRRVRLAVGAVASDNPFLYHKTTQRSVYQEALARFPDADDVLLMNERGELTESTIANLVIELDGKMLTPPVDSGLLPGTLREELLAEGELEEAVIYPEMLRRADGIWLINSVRGRMRVEVIDSW